MHKNRIIFEGGKVDEVEIFLQTQLQAWSWTKFGGGLGFKEHLQNGFCTLLIALEKLHN